MPNFSAFNTNPDELRVLIYGSDGANNVVLRTDAQGNISSHIVDGTISNVLGATITAGTVSSVETLLDGTISNVLGATITAGTVSSVETLLDGTISNVLGATITAGTLSSVTSISQKSFVEEIIPDVVTEDTFTGIDPIDTSVLGTYSFFIYNQGPAAADARVEISADGTNWYPDASSTAGIAAGSVDVLVPMRFLRYTRVAYRSSVAGSPTTLDIYFNGQGT